MFQSILVWPDGQAVLANDIFSVDIIPEGEYELISIGSSMREYGELTQVQRVAVLTMLAYQEDHEVSPKEF